jgi:YegS/Rv2252/BmrU family lipid kinase
MDGEILRRVLVLVNRKAGLAWAFEAVQKAFEQYWDVPGTHLVYQFCRDPADTRLKVRRAIQEGMQTVMVVGGDGTVNSVGAALVNTGMTMGVIPMGSGNGFARHFGIPLEPAKAIRSLAEGKSRTIDVGVVNGKPFLVTCSMAWDAAIVRSFEKSPVRGIIPYIFAGVYEFLGYRPKVMNIEFDTGEKMSIPDPIVFTIANLTQYGGGTIIAPHAQPDDGFLELVVAREQDAPLLIANTVRLFNGTLTEIPQVIFRRFRSLRVHRTEPANIQMDGELVDAPIDITVEVLPRALNILTPAVVDDTKPDKLPDDKGDTWIFG